MKGFTTQIVHNDRLGTIEHGSVHKPIHTSVAYGYEDTRELAAVFQGKRSGHTYSRQINPTVDALEAKVSKMENGLKTVCFGSGMAAIGTVFFALLRAGDHVVSSAFLFGNTNSLFNSFGSQGLDISFVDATKVEAVANAITPKTKMVFVETIANPRTQVAALKEIGQLCADKGLVYIVDNTMTSPYLFQPTQVKASLVVNSLTKYIGGHGNALGGAITEMGHFDWQGFENIYQDYQNGDAQMWGITQIKKKGLRDFGASLGPESAHHISVGSETLALRLERQCANSQKLAEYLHQHAQIGQVFYPGLVDHPEHARSCDLFRHHGGVLSFELGDGVDLWDYMDKLKVVIRSTNLGDNRTLAIPVAHTIYYEMGAQRRKMMGINDSLIRVSLGIEDIDDLIEDFERAFS
ncbi:MAG: cystathionine gamma-synthase family protein [Gammaproteobacteria bacterium]|nr:cystathionine gamma-synthase family protein [Gammaproteobacteria bacterium]